jgi:hypothetical protein
MRNERPFQSRRARRVLGGAVAVGLLAASGVLVGVGIASSPKIALVTTASSSSTTTTIPTSGKVTICHHTHSKHNPFVTITISVRAWPAHLKHGDAVGACVRSTTTTTTATTTTTTMTAGTTTAGSAHAAAPLTSGPGRSGQHGQGNGQGHGQGNGRGHR